MVRLRPLFKPQQLRAAIITPLCTSTTTTTTQQTQLFRPASSSFSTPTIPASFSFSCPFSSSPASASAGSASASAGSASASAKEAPWPSNPSPPPLVPPPTPFVPDVPTFLKVIGRGLSQHASKFPSWEALFTLTSEQLRELGIEPPRTRRYLLQWRQRFRRGQFGIGGDLRHVAEDGTAELRILEMDKIVPPAAAAAAAAASDGEVPPAAAAAAATTTDPVRKARFVVNVPPGHSPKELGPEQMSRVQGFKIKGAKTIAGPYALPLKDKAGARVTVTEGMWEDRRGHKIDGGERRRTKVRYKKRIAERRELREQGLL